MHRILESDNRGSIGYTLAIHGTVRKGIKHMFVTLLDAENRHFNYLSAAEHKTPMVAWNSVDIANIHGYKYFLLNI